MFLNNFAKTIRFARYKQVFLLFSLLMSLVACAPSTPINSATPRPLIITAAPNATPTATPFQPVDESLVATEPPVEATLTQPDFASWGDFPPPQVYPFYIQIPPPASRVTQPPGQVSILLLGSDQRPNESGFRTDTMILIVVNPDGKASLTSFPRDLYVYIPGWMMNRLNTAQGFGGFTSMQLTFEYNFGIRPDYYVLINFDGFRSIVNNLGGITVNVGQTFSDSRSGYPYGYTLYPGLVPMDSETALWYVRSRYSSNDIDRLRRAQEVLQAIGVKLLSLDGLNRVPDLYNAYRSSVETNLSLDACLRLLPAANLIRDPSIIRRYTLGYDQAYDWIDPSTGAMVLVPVASEVQKVIQQAITMP